MCDHAGYAYTQPSQCPTHEACDLWKLKLGCCQYTESPTHDETVRVWKISTGEEIHKFEGHAFKVYSVALDHMRNRCISRSIDQTVKIWCLETVTLLCI